MQEEDSDDDFVQEEQRKNFAPYRHKRLKSISGKAIKSVRPQSWTHKYVCLAYCDQRKVPTTTGEKYLLNDAGLGEKKITVPNVKCCHEELKEIITDSFPKLKNCGGFEFLRCLPNSRELQVIPANISQCPQVLQTRVGSGKIYIRPIQKDLDLTSTIEETEASTVSYLLSLLQKFVVCMCFARFKCDCLLSMCV